MLYIMLCSPQGELIQTQDIEQVRAAYQKKEAKIWVDIEDPSDEEVDLLLEVFHFHPLAVEDVVIDIGVPKIDTYDGYSFLALHRLFYNFETESCQKREFEIFFSDWFIVTIHESNLSRTFAAARKAVADNPKKTLARSSGYVLVRLLQLALKDYRPVMEEWEANLEEIEEQLLREQMRKDHSDSVLEKILSYKRLVATMRRSFLPERDIMVQLYERFEESANAELKPYFKRLMNDVNALLHDLEALRDRVTGVFDVYAAVLSMQMNESSHKLNFVMQRLTIAATIFLPLTFIVGVYGMNFEYMPEFHWKGFYYLLWILMIVLTVGMLAFFRKRKWL